VGKSQPAAAAPKKEVTKKDEKEGESSINRHGCEVPPLSRPCLCLNLVSQLFKSATNFSSFVFLLRVEDFFVLKMQGVKFISVGHC
jgi:hypothetical protein